MNTKILEQLGLSSNEIKTYLALIDIGKATASEISSRAQINRSNCYEALEKLINKGLIGKIKDEKKTIFESLSSKKLSEIYLENKSEIDILSEELEQRRGISKEKKSAMIIEGYRGIKSIFEDILESLNPNQEYLVFGATDVPELFENYINHWTKRRIQKKIRLRIIYNEDAKSFIGKTKKLPLTEIRVLPKSYSTPAAVNIYGNKTANIVWTDKPLAFLVENEDYTKSFRNYFELLWKIAKP